MELTVTCDSHSPEQKLELCHLKWYKHVLHVILHNALNTHQRDGVEPFDNVSRTDSSDLLLKIFKNLWDLTNYICW